METLTADQITRVIVDDEVPGYNLTQSGYGGKVPTRYRVKLTDGRTRRIYAAVYGNSGSAYVVRGGQDAYLSQSADWLIELVRGGRDTDAARAFMLDAVARWPASLREGDAGFSL